MNKIVCLLKFLSFLVVINFGDCNPKCYICDSKSDPNCADPVKHNMVAQECLPTNLADTKKIVENSGLAGLAGYLDIEINRNDINVPLNCIKAVTNASGTEYILRGCQIAIKEDLNVCKKLLEEKKDIMQHCSLCDKDRCNSAPIKTKSALFIILIIPTLIFL